jgi:acetolactate synthase-1/3 small subunit
MFKAQIADVTPKALVIEAVGSVARIESLLDMLRPYGIKEIARTGRVAVARGGTIDG